MSEFSDPVGSFKIQGLDWLKIDWSRDSEGKKMIHVIMEGVVLHPYVRQTYRSRWRRDRWGERCRQYNDQQAMFRDALNLKMKEIGEYGNMGYDKKKLGLSVLVDMSDKTRLAVCDLGNLVKAVEDFCNKSVISDDRYVFRYGICEKRLAAEDRIELFVFEI